MENFDFLNDDGFKDIDGADWKRICNMLVRLLEHFSDATPFLHQSYSFEKDMKGIIDILDDYTQREKSICITSFALSLIEPKIRETITAAIIQAYVKRDKNGI